MAKFSFDILFFSSKDLDRVIPITKRFNLKCRFLEHSDGSSYLMKFDSDYEEYEFFKELENIFEFDYQKKDEITLGKYDIRINIRRFQDPYFLDS